MIRYFTRLDRCLVGIEACGTSHYWAREIGKLGHEVRFAIKSPEQQAALAMHRTRDLFVKQRTQLVNMIRSLPAEFGIEIRRGITHALMVAKCVAADDMPDVPPLAAKVIAGLAG